MQIYYQARMFGCQEVIICSDQGPTEMIYNNVNYPADKLKEYAQSFQYLKDTTWLEEWEKEEMLEEGFAVPYVFGSFTTADYSAMMVTD